jgi:hypothetical protein
MVRGARCSSLVSRYGLGTKWRAGSAAFELCKLGGRRRCGTGVRRHSRAVALEGKPGISPTVNVESVAQRHAVAASHLFPHTYPSVSFNYDVSCRQRTSH